MSKPRSMQADTLRSVTAATITASYQNLGDALSNNWTIIILKNATNKTVFISENGTDDHYELLPGGVDVIDLQSNARDGFFAHKKIGTQFRVKGIAGALPEFGKVILQGQYV